MWIYGVPVQHEEETVVWCDGIFNSPKLDRIKGLQLFTSIDSCSRVQSLVIHFSRASSVGAWLILTPALCLFLVKLWQFDGDWLPVYTCILNFLLDWSCPSWLSGLWCRSMLNYKTVPPGSRRPQAQGYLVEQQKRQRKGRVSQGPLLSSTLLSSYKVNLMPGQF